MTRIWPLGAIVVLLGCAYVRVEPEWGATGAAALVLVLVALALVILAFDYSLDGRDSVWRWARAAERFRSFTIATVCVVGAPLGVALSMVALSNGVDWTWLFTLTACLLLTAAGWFTLARRVRSVVRRR